MALGAGISEGQQSFFPIALAWCTLRHLPCSLANRLVIRGRKWASTLPPRPVFQRLNSLQSHFGNEAGKLTREMQNITRSGQSCHATRYSTWGEHEISIVRRTADSCQRFRMKQAATALLVLTYASLIKRSTALEDRGMSSSLVENRTIVVGV